MLATANQRVLQRTAGVFTFGPRDPDGEPSTVDPGTVTVTITRSDGTALYTDAATTADGVSRTFTLAVTDTALLDILTATWKVAGVTIGITTLDVVGDYFFPLAQLRAVEKSVSDPSKYPNSALAAFRTEVESSFESWTNYAWVPRFSVVDVTPAGYPLITDLFDITAIRWLRSYTTPSSYTSFTAPELALLAGTSWGAIDNSGTWWGSYRVVAGVEHGVAGPPPELRAAAFRYARRLATRATSGVSDRATSYTTPEGQVVSLGRIGTDWRPTGDEIIDEVLRRPDIDHRIVYASA